MSATVRHRRGARLQTGFTLLELLISMALLGLILVLLFGGLRLAVRSWDAVQQQVDSVNLVRSVESLLRREFAIAYPYRWKIGPDQRMAFHGERNKIQFVAQLPLRVGDGGLYIVSLELQQDGRGKRMVWKHAPLNSLMRDFSGLEQASEMLLAASELNGIEDIWLTYFGRENENAAPRWMDRWDSASRLPMLIRIQVRLASGAASPDFVVASRMSVEFVR